MRATLTTIGLYNYDPTLFDLLEVPQGASKDTLINQILLEYGEMSVIYSDPDFYKFAIGKWSAAEQDNLSRYWEVMHKTYDPLQNYDRTETVTESGSHTRETETSKTESGETSRTTGGTHTGSGTDARTTGSTERTQGTRTETPNLTDTVSSAPYNTEALTTRERTQKTGSMGTSDDYSTTDNGTDNLTISRSDTTTGTDAGEHSLTGSGTEEETGSNTFTRTARMYGNIGVTPSQAMLLAELDVAEHNFYEWAAGLFASRFCVLIY